MFEAVVYALCFLTSATCAWLLISSYFRRGQRLLLWSASCFCLLAANNFLVFADLVLLPTIDLLPIRQVTSLLAITLLLYGFIWETD
jgi:hypothetical protein